SLFSSSSFRLVSFLSMTTLLGLFAKPWTSGGATTHLAATLGAARAAAIERLFVATLARRFGSLADHRLLAFTAADETDLREIAAERWELAPQAAHDVRACVRPFFEAGLARAD